MRIVVFQIVIGIFFTATCKLAAGEVQDSCTIYLKNGQTPIMKFHEVLSFCFVNEKGEGVNFTVIDSILTTDSVIARTILQSAPGTSLQSRENGYLLNFVKYLPSHIEPTSIFPFKPSNITVALRMEPSSQVGFVYDAELFNHKNLIHRFQGGIGFRNKESLFSSMNFAFGLGAQFFKGIYRVSFTANYGLYRESPPLKEQGVVINSSAKNKINSEAITGTVFFISQATSLKIDESSSYFLTLGFDLYLYTQEKRLPLNPLTIYFGFGTEL